MAASEQLIAETMSAAATSRIVPQKKEANVQAVRSSEDLLEGKKSSPENCLAVDLAPSFRFGRVISTSVSAGSPASLGKAPRI